LEIDILHNPDMYHYIGYTYGFTFRQVKEGIQFINTAMSFRNGGKNQWDYLRRAQLYLLIKDFDAAKNDLAESIAIARDCNDQTTLEEATRELNKIK